MPSTMAPPAESQEPTLKDVLNAVNGLGTEVGSLRSEVGGLRTEVAALTTLSDTKFTHTAKEIALIRSDIAEFKQAVDARFEEVDGQVTEIWSDVRVMKPQVEEALRLGRDNRKTLQAIKEDITRVDQKLDLHLADHEVHLPRPRRADVSDAGPVAA